MQKNSNTNIKKGTITKRTISAIFLVVLVLITSISASVGLRLRQEMLDLYSKSAFSYTKAAAEYIDGDKIEYYLKTGNKDAYYEEISNYLSITAKQSIDKDEKSGKVLAGIRYFYVFVPGEKDITYIWDASEDEPAELLEHEEYDEGGKEMAQKVFKEQAPEEFHSYSYEGTIVLTASSPIFNSEGKPVAIVAVDLLAENASSSARRVLLGIIIPIIFVMLLTMLVYYFVTNKLIISPIIKLNQATEEIVDNLDNDKEIKIDIHTNDEIEMLANSFEDMEVRLKNYIIQNAAITAEKERIGTELELATRIQADMLPNVFPAFPERDEFDIYATMTPAKEVGGDFYDFFLVDKTHLAMVIADVSGKGIPAALFMMMSKILIQNAAMSGLPPAKVLEAVNNQICSNNREEMFVTVWLGIIDLESGLMKAANAGHEKPIIKTPDGEFKLIKDKHGFVIGGMDGLKYSEYELQFEKGTKLFVYTDGVVEATNINDELYGDERTVTALNEAKNETPKKILDYIHKSVDEYVGTAPQFDDLTMLCFEYIGSKEKITVDATLDNVSKAVDFVSRKAANLPFSKKDKYQLEVAVDEIVCNIARYAYPEGDGTATVRTDTDDNGITITISDSGTPYNPLEKEDPDVTLSAEERGIGGYGIFLVKKVMDEVTYEYRNGLNILVMKKNYKN